jgi:hypothetical protein
MASRTLFVLMLFVLMFVARTAPVSAQGEVEIIVFRDADSLTIYIPGNQTISLLNLGFEVTIDGKRQLYLLQDYEAFDALYFERVLTPSCFRLESQECDAPVPQACHGATLLIQRLSTADVFWYDSAMKQERTVLLMSVPSNVGICPAGQPQCVLLFVLPTPVPSPPLPPLGPTVTANRFAAGQRNGNWRPIVREFRGLPVVYVPAGCFMKGSERGHEPEHPVHEVCVDAFWMSQTEITNTQYGDCVKAGQCLLPQDPEFYYSEVSADHPVVNVDWYQSNTYAAWLGGSLLGEAQWEYAARGPEGWTYPWGNEFDGTRLNFCDVNCESSGRDPIYNDGYTTTAPVGTYRTGALWVGALDMAGNVWEWVADWEGKYLRGSKRIREARTLEIGGFFVVAHGGMSQIMPAPHSVAGIPPMNTTLISGSSSVSSTARMIPPCVHQVSDGPELVG